MNPFRRLSSEERFRERAHVDEIYVVGGVRMSVRDMERLSGMKADVLRKRLGSGWDPLRAATVPVRGWERSARSG